MDKSKILEAPELLKQAVESYDPQPPSIQTVPVSMFDFQDGRGPVPAARHRNPDGSEGGWVAATAKVDASCYIGPDAQVYEDARVYGNAEVYGNARVYGNALVSENALVYGNARVYGSARVSGNTWLSGNARVSENVTTTGEVK